MQVKYMKPFYTKITGDKLHLVFAHQYLTVEIDGEDFYFIPIGSKGAVININTQQIENENDVFVFQRGKSFKRIPLYELLLADGFQDKINEIVSNVTGKKIADVPDEVMEIADCLIKEIVEFNRNNLIDKLLDAKDFDGLTKIME